MRAGHLLTMALMLFGVSEAQASSAKIIYDFSAPNAKIFSPDGGVVVGKDGQLYGVAQGSTDPSRLCGYVYRLGKAVGASTWTLDVLYEFKGGRDGCLPRGRLAVDPKSGALYGTTRSGGGYQRGTVFKLAPPAGAGGSWTESIVHVFEGEAGGSYPDSGVVRASDGTLYGTASYKSGDTATHKGLVFALKPVSGGWVRSTLYRFKGKPDGDTPFGSLHLDVNGELYGTTVAGGGWDAGTFYVLKPPLPGTLGWTKKILYGFRGGAGGVHPNGSLVRDSSGAFYGTTESDGASKYYGDVFKLTPPTTGSTWTKTDLHKFDGFDGRNPLGGVYLDSATGVIYGTTSYSVFKLTPSPAGWTETAIKIFGGWPGFNTTLIRGPGGALYGTSWGDGSSAGAGWIIRVVP